MTEAEQQQAALEQPKAVPKQKEVLATKVTGTVKSGYGFINRNDTKEDAFVHQSAIIKNNPKKAVPSVGDSQLVEFSVVVGEKANVTGPNGDPVKSSPYAADRRRGYRQWYFPTGRRGRRGGSRGGPFRESQSEGELKDGVQSGGEGGGRGGQGQGPPRHYAPRRGRGGYGYYKGPYRGSAGQLGQNGDVPRGRRPPRGFFYRNFRGGRVGPGPRSYDSQGQAGKQNGQEGGPLRQRYRRRNQPCPKAGNSQSESAGGNQPVQNITTKSSA